MTDFEVTKDNIKECYEYYEAYKEEFNKTHYSDAVCEEFIAWSEENLMKCPNCGEIVLKDEQEHLYQAYNSDNVCDWCIENLEYYE